MIFPMRDARQIRFLSTCAVGERKAAQDLLSQLHPWRAGRVVLFCTPQHDLGRLGAALRAGGVEDVTAATTGRSIQTGEFVSHSIVGFHLPASRFKVADALIEDAARFGLQEARDLTCALRKRLGRSVSDRFPHQFGMLLVDGESRCEERLTAALGTELAGVPLVGGSAGDSYFHPGGLSPGAARILHRGTARRGSAVLYLVASATPVYAVSHTHYVPGRRRVVITEADPARRLVIEIDGQRAVESYARAAGLPSLPRDAGDCAPHPLMIRIGGQYFARGLQRLHPDGALEFACAMEPGMVLAVARPGDMVVGLSGMFGQMRAAIGEPELVIGFECSARTVEMERAGLASAVGKVFADNAVVGFCTLGEQFNTIHVNNSFTCVGIAREGD